MRSCFSMILAFLLVLALVPVALSFPAGESIFNPRAYQAALQDQGFFEQLPGLVGNLLEEQAAASNQPLVVNALANMKINDYQELTRLLFPGDTLEAQADGWITNLFAYLAGDLKEPDIAIDLRDVKQRLNGDAGLQAGRQIMSTWPQCQPGDLGKLTGLLQKSQSESIPLCQPPAALQPLVDPLIQASLVEFTSDMPDSLNILAVQPGTGGDGFTRLRENYQLALGLLRALGVAALVLLGLLMAMNLPVRRGTFQWPGWAVLIAGLLCWLVVLLIAASGRVLESTLVSGGGVASAAMMEVIVELINTVFGRFLLGSAVTGLVLVVVGLFLAFFVHPRAGEVQTFAQA